ncbi:hypothetical protein [Stenotrophomonas sp. ESTM1D_MKCIP4_1]|uniref:hypothetical protein n=1 Tax=Stenotrophomonas sp. ESTM1D_MKCIP4_1 TaxID=2072414 RepID=UPI00131ED6E2|nr:hypothetical protein [Stenotrophomonas sp. ESTM1D_MKCIP4_1]
MSALPPCSSSILKIAGEERLYVKCYEIPHGERYADNADLNIFSIDESLVESILDSADKEVQRQRES